MEGSLLTTVDHSAAFEYGYKMLIDDILRFGEPRSSRNGKTMALFGKSLEIDLSAQSDDFIPLLNGRQMYPKGIFGEFSAFMHNAKTVEEFRDYGCNYWDLWADSSGRLELDYSEQLFNFNGVNQVENIIKSLKEDPQARRHVISLWRPDRFDEISLHCCHYSYQFYVNNINELNMIWTQRSADIMIGVPSDIILAYLWVKLLCLELDLKPGVITMNFGDCHIYKEHIKPAKTYLHNIKPKLLPLAKVTRFSGITQFMANDIEVYQYEPHEPIKFELKA